MPKAKTSKSDLYGKWVHAHEEDTDTEMVFRPPGHPLPPSRGRTAFELRNDETCAYLGIGRDDRGEASSGSWRFDEQTSALSLNLPDGTHQVFPVASADKEKLVVKKPK